VKVLDPAAAPGDLVQVLDRDGEVHGWGLFKPRSTVARGTMICVEHLAAWRDSLDDGEGSL